MCVIYQLSKNVKVKRIITGCLQSYSNIYIKGAWNVRKEIMEDRVEIIILKNDIIVFY